jgi:hypothetical protein
VDTAVLEVKGNCMQQTSSQIIAETHGLDVEVMRARRYKQGDTGKYRVFVIEKDYYCVSDRAPRTEGVWQWELHHDQSVAERNSTSLWISKGCNK